MPASKPPAPPATSREGRRPELDDAPPVLGSWRNIYLVVLGTLAATIGLFWLLTEAYA